MKHYDVAIIGGGIAGLSTAYRLSKKRKKVIVIEKEKEFGGMLRSIKKKKYTIEEFYHHILPNNNEIVDLIEELGLIDKFKWRNATTAFFYKNKFYRLSNPFDLLFFKPLSFFEKIKLGLFLLKIKLIKNPGKFDHVSAEDFIINKAGNGVYKKFFEPLLAAKYGKNLHKISAAWFIERINIRNKRGYNGELLGYLEGGFDLLIQRLIQGIKTNGGDIIKGKKVTKIFTKSGIATGLQFGNQKISAKNFLSTISGPGLSKICNFPKKYKQKLHSLRNQGAICVVLAFKKKVGDYYWTNIISDSTEFKALIEHTNYMPFSVYDESIIYLASYPDEDSKIWKLSENKMFDKYFVDLQKLFPITKKDLNWFKVIKDKEAGLIYNKGILNKILPVETPIPNFYIAGMLNSYPDRNLNESINLSNKVINNIENESNASIA